MLDELLSKINDCVNELDGISEELSFEIDTTEINEAIDNLYKAYKKALEPEEEYEPDLYHSKLQERLDEGRYGYGN